MNNKTLCASAPLRHVVNSENEISQEIVSNKLQNRNLAPLLFGELRVPDAEKFSGRVL